MACNPQTKTIAVGTELHNHEASILLWYVALSLALVYVCILSSGRPTHKCPRDVRSSPTPQAAYHDLHSDDITTLTYHPSSPSILLSGSTDGLVNVYDTSVPDEDDITIQTLNLNASIHRAGFLDSSSLVYALSHDERFAVYDVSEAHASGDAVKDFGDLRTQVECQYVADVVPKSDGTGAIIGAGAQEYVFLSFSILQSFCLSHAEEAYQMNVLTAVKCSS
jgi:WD repeat-containing protein 89